MSRQTNRIEKTGRRLLEAVEETCHVGARISGQVKIRAINKTPRRVGNACRSHLLSLWSGVGPTTPARVGCQYSGWLIRAGTVVLVLRVVTRASLRFPAWSIFIVDDSAYLIARKPAVQ